MVTMNIGSIYFDKYKVIELLGQGGTSDVYLAENVKLGNFFAIKKALKNDNRINLLAEPNILKHLNHPAIPKIIDIEEDDEAIYIIEEYINGTHLKSFKCANQKIEEAQLVDWALQICNVLKYLHQRKPNPIIYRDLKPENIILMEDGQLKIIDFGIAREYKEESTNDTVPIGTRGYAAPEQYGIGQSDERTDIFSLGMTLYYLLTNKNLSHPPHKIQLTEQLNIRASEKIIAIITRCCETLPSKRYQNVEQVEIALIEITLVAPIKQKDGFVQEDWPIQEDQLIQENRTIQENQPIRANQLIQEEMNSEYKLGKKTVIIGVLGVNQGAGVTHTAIMMADILSKKNSVALLELNTSKHFLEIGLTIKNESIIREQKFRYQKTDYYWDIALNAFWMKYRDRYEYIIVDLGSYEQLMDIEEFIRCDIPVVCAQGIDWKLKDLQQFIEKTKRYNPNGSWAYLIPLLDEKSVKKINKEMNNEMNKEIHIKLRSLPYNMNPFNPSNEVKRVMESIVFAQ